MKTMKELTVILSLAGATLFLQGCGEALDLPSSSKPASKDLQFNGAGFGPIDPGGAGGPADPMGPIANEIFKNKCTFRFRGSNGAQWLTERYIRSTDSCGIEMETVKANNPNATILGVSQNFVKDITEISKWKCTYSFRGENGATWFSERYIATDACQGEELSKVRANNPKATVTGITRNYVHDPVQSPHKNKCTFHLVDQAGLKRIVERYLLSDESCTKEVALVKANNPKSSLVLVETNYVHDPY